jgi:hypothetical protein
MEIMYQGGPFTVEDRETELRLISKKKDEQGRKTILRFTKDIEKSCKAVGAIAKMIKKQIVAQFYMNSQRQ